MKRYLTVGPENDEEIQIRSERMDDCRERICSSLQLHMEKRNMKDIQFNKLQDVLLIYSTCNWLCWRLQIKFLFREIYALQSDLKSIKSGSTAPTSFHVHTDIGIKTRGARVT